MSRPRSRMPHRPASTRAVMLGRSGRIRGESVGVIGPGCSSNSAFVAIPSVDACRGHTKRNRSAQGHRASGGTQISRTGASGVMLRRCGTGSSRMDVDRRGFGWLASRLRRNLTQRSSPNSALLAQSIISKLETGSPPADALSDARRDHRRPPAGPERSRFRCVGRPRARLPEPPAPRRRLPHQNVRRTSWLTPTRSTQAQAPNGENLAEPPSDLPRRGVAMRR